MAAFDWVPIRQATDPIGSDVPLAGGTVPAQRGDVGAEVIEVVRIALSSGRVAACLLGVVRDADQLARGRGWVDADFAHTMVIPAACGSREPGQAVADLRGGQGTGVVAVRIAVTIEQQRGRAAHPDHGCRATGQVAAVRQEGVRADPHGSRRRSRDRHRGAAGGRSAPSIPVRPSQAPPSCCWRYSQHVVPVGRAL